MYSKCRLSEKESFSIDIFPGVSWVPYNILGGTKFADKEIYNLYKVSGFNQLVEEISNPFELIQLLQVNNFKSALDFEVVESRGRRFEYHKHGKEALINKSGSCATYSGLFYYLHKQRGYDVSNVVMLTYPGDGHAMNFIKKKDFYFFCDMHSQLNEFAEFLSRENSQKIEFLRARYKTASCLMTHNIEDFIKLINKYNALNGRRYIFLVCQAAIIPPISTCLDGDIMKIWLNTVDNWEVIGEAPYNILIYNQKGTLYNE